VPLPLLFDAHFFLKFFVVSLIKSIGISNTTAALQAEAAELEAKRKLKLVPPTPSHFQSLLSRSSSISKLSSFIFTHPSSTHQHHGHHQQHHLSTSLKLSSTISTLSPSKAGRSAVKAGKEVILK